MLWENRPEAACPPPRAVHFPYGVVTVLSLYASLHRCLFHLFSRPGASLARGVSPHRKDYARFGLPPLPPLYATPSLSVPETRRAPAARPKTHQAAATTTTTTMVHLKHCCPHQSTQRSKYAPQPTRLP